MEVQVVKPDLNLQNGEVISESSDIVSASSAQNPATSQGVSEKDQADKAKKIDDQALTTSDKLFLQKLRQIDISVRSHERAHLSAAGGLAVSGASYQYKRGADGKDYAVAGEVRIDTSQAGSPEETASKMQRVRSAALAPADPSPQDRSVAARASKIMLQSQMEIRETRNVEMREENPPNKETEGTAEVDEKQNVGEKNNGENRQASRPEITFQKAEAAAGYKAFSANTGPATGTRSGVDLTV